MTLQELNEMIERVAAQPGVSEFEKMKSLSWMLNLQEYQSPRTQQDSMTLQELNEMIERVAAQPGLREFGQMKSPSWMLDPQEYRSQSAARQYDNSRAQWIDRTCRGLARMALSLIMAGLAARSRLTVVTPARS